MASECRSWVIGKQRHVTIKWDTHWETLACVYPDPAFAVTNTHKSAPVLLKTLTWSSLLGARPCMIWVLSASLPPSCPLSAASLWQGLLSVPQHPSSPLWWWSQRSTEYVSQPCLDLGVTLWLSSQEWKVGRSDACNLCFLPCIGGVCMSSGPLPIPEGWGPMGSFRLRDWPTHRRWQRGATSPGSLAASHKGRQTSRLFKPLDLGLFMWKPFILDSN